MAQLDFPASPSINQEFTGNGITYTWTGTHWEADGGSGGSGGTTDLYGTAAAWGNVERNGTLKGGRNCTVSRTALGRYSVVFDTPMTNDNYSVTYGTVYNSEPTLGGYSDTLSKTSTGFTVGTNAVTDGQMNDYEFCFAVFDDKPVVINGGSGGSGGTTDLYGMAKAWGNVAPNGALLSGYNVSSATYNGGGNYSITFTNPMASDDYAVTFGCMTGADSYLSSGSSSAMSIIVRDADTQAAAQDAFFFACYDDQPVTVSGGGGSGGNFVKIAGDTMTGALNVPAGATGTQVLQSQEILPFLPVAFGSQDQGENTSGVIDHSVGASITQVKEGQYTVTLNTALTNVDYAVVATIIGGETIKRDLSVQKVSSSRFDVWINDSTLALRNGRFSYVVYAVP